ncbi:SelT/SelW/SelH family protein [Rhodococcus sp. NPDC004095]
MGSPEAHRARVRITYCTQCQWLLRAAWMAQELLSTFGTDLGEVALVPGTGGVFLVEVDGAVVWDRSRDGGFPEAKVLKQRVRDVIDPGRDLGHADRPRDPRTGRAATGLPDPQG